VDDASENTVEEPIGDSYRPVVDVIFGQMLGLYCSVAHDL
jgi:hypothetical protein